MRTKSRTFAQETVALRTGRDPEELIRELYVEKRLSDREIGTAIGVPRALVAAWRSKWGISRDDRPDPQELIA